MILLGCETDFGKMAHVEPTVQMDRLCGATSLLNMQKWHEFDVVMVVLVVTYAGKLLYEARHTRELGVDLR